MPAVPAVDRRAERVLDAAADLLVRRGYRRVTIEDVARHAGVGKGTVYLHFSTKDALFLIVMLRIHRRLNVELAVGIDGDPSLALPWRTMSRVFRRIAADDIARPIYLGDPETLGRLAHESASTFGEIGRIGTQVVLDQFTLLRDAGLVRTDLGIEEQIHTYGAVTTGFFVVGDMTEGSLGPLTTPDTARRAELLEHTLAALLRGADDARRLADVAPAVADGYRTLVAHLDDEWDRRTR